MSEYHTWNLIAVLPTGGQPTRHRKFEVLFPHLDIVSSMGTRKRAGRSTYAVDVWIDSCLFLPGNLVTYRRTPVVSWFRLPYTIGYSIDRVVS